MRLDDYTEKKLKNDAVELFQIEGRDLSSEHLRWLRDPHVGRFLEARFQEHSPESTLNFVSDCEAALTALLLGIRRMDTHAYVGNIKLSWDPHHGVGDIGLMIGDKASWGQGLATSAISLMCRVGFSFVGLRKIMAGAYASNVASIRAFERNGFKTEATLVNHVLQDGVPDCVCMMRLFETEYAGSKLIADDAKNSVQTAFDQWCVAMQTATQKSQLSCHFASQNIEDWQSVWTELSYQPVACQIQMVEYQHDYQRGVGMDVVDVSMVIHHDGKPVGIWVMTLSIHKGKKRISSAGSPLMPPTLVNGLTDKSIKSIFTKALAFLQSVCDSLQMPMPHMQCPVMPEQARFGLSEWQQQLLRNRVLPCVRYELFIDLQPSISNIRQSFRKSYKSLINKGFEIFDVDVVDRIKVTPLIWQEFKSLHLEVAGRKTRTDSSWECQYGMIQSESAFLVTARDRTTARLIGAGFFQHSRDEGLYSVAAYDRSLFDKPIGHAVQQLAIERMKSLGIKWYRIGDRRYEQEMPPPSAKEIAISEFKHGFASHEFIRHEYRWPVKI